MELLVHQFLCHPQRSAESSWVKPWLGTPICVLCCLCLLKWCQLRQLHSVRDFCPQYILQDSLLGAASLHLAEYFSTFFLPASCHKLQAASGRASGFTSGDHSVYLVATCWRTLLLLSLAYQEIRNLALLTNTNTTNSINLIQFASCRSSVWKAKDRHIVAPQTDLLSVIWQAWIRSDSSHHIHTEIPQIAIISVNTERHLGWEKWFELKSESLTLWTFSL